MIDTIVTGDCLQVTNEIETESVHLIMTSPPYPGQKNDKRTVTEWLEWFTEVAWKMRRVLVPNGVAVINVNFKRLSDGFCDHRLYTALPKTMRGFSLLDVYPFIKANPAPNGANSDGVYADIPAWEPIFVFSKAESPKDIYFEPVRKPYKPKSFASNGKIYTTRTVTPQAEPHPNGARQPNYLIVSTSGTSRKDYPRAEGQSFPPAVPERFILQYTRPGDVVLDPFAGVGTTCPSRS
jgi:DNA modification methylase